jgi:hypothetical protein
MKLKKNILPYFTLLLFSSSILAFDTGFIENIEKRSVATEESEMIQGVVFDRTITQTGFVFYQAFIQLWRAETNLHRHSITLRETPTARQGSIIWIEEGNVLLYKFVISLRNQKIQKKAENSLKTIRLKLNANRFTSF